MYKYSILSKISLLSLGLLLSCSLFEKDKVKFDECTLSYGSTNTFYLSPTDSNVTVKPTQPTTRGVYVAEPHGLVIDNYTGEVNVSRSLTGQQYKVRFVSLDNKSFCDTDIIISGLDYPDGIYSISNPQQATLNPIYNVNPRNPIPQDSNIDEPNQQGQTARNQGLIVNTTSGALDLKASIATGQFNSIKDLPRPRTITFLYRLKDPSDQALNSITLNIYYFSSESRIPESLREELKRKQEYPKGGRVGKFLEHDPPYIIVTDQ